MRARVLLAVILGAYLAGCGSSGPSSPSTSKPSATSTIYPTTTVLADDAFSAPRDATSEIAALFPGGLSGSDLPALAVRLADALEAEARAAAPDAEVPATATVKAVGPDTPAVVVVSLRGGEGDDSIGGHEILARFEQKSGAWSLTGVTERMYCLRGVDGADRTLCV